MSAAEFHGPTLTGLIGTVSATSFTLTDASGTVWTISVSPSTIVTESGRQISSTALSSGERVRVFGSATSTVPDTLTATKIAVELARIDGTVVTSGSGSFVVSDRFGLWRVVVESPSTTYFIGSKKLSNPTTAAAVVTGVRVDVMGTVDANHTSLDAITVDIKLAQISGTVTSVSPTGFVLSSNGSMISVTTSSSTLYWGPSGRSSVSSVAVGEPAIAFGASTGTDAFTADYVIAWSPVPPTPHPIVPTPQSNAPHTTAAVFHSTPVALHHHGFRHHWKR